MKKTIISSVAALVLAFTTSCSIYHPQAVDIPLINHAQDTRIDASLGLSVWVIPDVFTFNTTVSYGFNDWLAGQAHINYGGDNVYAQLAPGAYFPLGEHAVFETYAGLGFGGAWRDDLDSRYANESDTTHFKTYDYSGRYILPFIQGNIGWHDLTAVHIDLGFGLKVGGYFPNYDSKKYDNSGTIIAGSETTYDNFNLLVEPQFIFRIGSENFKFNVKCGFSWLSDIYAGSSTSVPFTADIITASAGFTFSF